MSTQISPPPPPSLSTDFPFESRFIDVLGSKIHYIDEGEGDPIIFMHGIPTSNYLWRNVIPHFKGKARCIAPDLIGMGKSDKPDIEYRVFDHIRYIEAFIDALKLKNITLVMHAWGSVVGFDIAMRQQDNIKGLAFYEAHIRPTINWDMVSLPVQELSEIFDNADGGYDIIMNSNYYVNKVLPSGILRNLSEKEMDYYRMPFTQSGSCLPIWQYLQDLPLGDSSSDVVELINNFSKKLVESPLPKLMFYGVPGFITTIDTVRWAKENLPNLHLVDLGDALHYYQEYNPDLLANEILNWFAEIKTV